MSKYLYGCLYTNCVYRNWDGCCVYFLVNDRTRTSLHLGENVDINDPCREYTPKDGKRRPPAKPDHIKKRSVVQCSMDGEVLHVYRTLGIAEAVTGINRKAIGLCCNGKQPHAGGYRWHYKEETACTTSR